MNRVMLRFRPIAPKPVTDGSSSMPEGKKSTHEEVVSKRRAKRKYVRVKKKNTTTTPSKCSSSTTIKEEQNNEEDRRDGSVVTLQLLPESSGSSSSSSVKNQLNNGAFWMNYYCDDTANGFFTVMSPDPSDLKVATETPRMVESWVMVEGITTRTFVDGDHQALGSTTTDMEKIMKNMEMDTCPTFISDGFDRVQWVNSAYTRMVDPLEDGGPPAEMVVRLVVKENNIKFRAFACTVKVVYAWRNGKQTRTMPCDVWKMEFGGFAWRLDSQAALSLGR